MTIGETFRRLFGNVILGVPRRLSASLSGNDVVLTWLHPAAVPEYYKVFRDDVEIGEAETNTYTDEEVGIGTYNYHVTSMSANDDVGPTSDIVKVEVVVGESNGGNGGGNGGNGGNGGGGSQPQYEKVYNTIYLEWEHPDKGGQTIIMIKMPKAPSNAYIKPGGKGGWIVSEVVGQTCIGNKTGVRKAVCEILVANGGSLVIEKLEGDVGHNSNPGEQWVNWVFDNNAQFEGKTAAEYYQIAARPYGKQYIRSFKHEDGIYYWKKVT